ncbi:hypothetical protein ACHQM5_014804 [Ranunculus cassubicifolius]
MAETKKIDIKLLIDKERNKVLFAESDRYFVEILFSFLTMPIATIITLANKQSSLGCIDALYRSVEALDAQYFQTGYCKTMLLKPKSESDIKTRSLELTFDGYGNVPEYYHCPTWSCTTAANCLVSMFENTTCVCGQKMTIKGTAGSISIEDKRVNGVFLKGVRNKYTIYDDLEVRTLSNDTDLSVNLRLFGIKDGTALEERNVSVGIEEMKELLKRSMLSLTALTDVFLSKETEVNIKRIKREPIEHVESEPQAHTKTAKLKLVIHKPSNKVLYAVAKADFLDFLFSFLTFPAGSVAKLLEKYSSMGSIDKLFKSVEKLLVVEPENFRMGKELLLHPKIAVQHGCKNQLLKMKEQNETAVASIHKCSTCFSEKFYTGVCKHGLGTVNLRLVNPKYPDTTSDTGGGFIKESIAFMVTDELVVEPYSQISGIIYLNNHGVPFSELEEQSVTVGEKEALSLLKASLTSKTALTNVFTRKN